MRAVLISELKGNRAEQIKKIVSDNLFTFSVIMKPDASQRGASVRIIKTSDEMIKYINNTPGDVLIQEYHAGPEEVGIFYVKDPDKETGRIFSITGKKFPDSRSQRRYFRIHEYI